MQNTEPIACTLTAADLADRQRAWLKVGTYSAGSAEIAGGLAFRFRPEPGVVTSLEELIRLEAECCPWMRFALDDEAHTVRLSVTAAGVDGEQAVREMFGPLAEAGQQLRQP